MAKEQTSSTYELIKKLPAKGFDWTGFVAELRSQAMAKWQKGKDGRYAYCHEMTLAEWDAAKGLRQIREAAMQMACGIVSSKATRKAVIPPSEETLSWGGFLGGSIEVWTDEVAVDAATAEIHDLANKFKAAA